MRTGFDSLHTYYMNEQLNIFNDDQLRPDVKRPKRSGGGQHFQVSREECEICRDLDKHPKALFGDHLLLSAAICCEGCYTCAA